MSNFRSWQIWPFDQRVLFSSLLIAASAASATAQPTAQPAEAIKELQAFRKEIQDAAASLDRRCGDLDRAMTTLGAEFAKHRMSLESNTRGYALLGLHEPAKGNFTEGNRWRMYYTGTQWGPVAALNESIEFAKKVQAKKIQKGIDRAPLQRMREARAEWRKRNTDYQRHLWEYIVLQPEIAKHDNEYQKLPTGDQKKREAWNKKNAELLKRQSQVLANIAKLKDFPTFAPLGIPEHEVKFVRDAAGKFEAIEVIPYFERFHAQVVFAESPPRRSYVIRLAIEGAVDRQITIWRTDDARIYRSGPQMIAPDKAGRVTYEPVGEPQL